MPTNYKAMAHEWREAHNEMYREYVAVSKRLSVAEKKLKEEQAPGVAIPVVPVGSTIEPVLWMRVAQVAKRYSISRSTVYLLMSEGKIKSVCMRRKGNTRGSRLINVESVDLYFVSLGEE